MISEGQVVLFRFPQTDQTGFHSESFSVEMHDGKVLKG